MICPSCKNPMLVVEYQQIEIDYCSNCQGVWFDAGELELILDSAGIGETQKTLDALLGAQEVSTHEKKLKCPICKHNMKKINIGDTKPVIIDTCFREDGVWFDGGEVDHLIKYLIGKSSDMPGASKVFDFIKEVFQSKPDQ